jgi:hypothetical protein
MVILPRVCRSIAKAMRDVDDEARKNDWVRGDHRCSWCRRWSGGSLGRARTSGCALQRRRGVDRQGTGRQPSGRHDWKLSERFEQGEIDIDPDDDKLAAQLGSLKWGIDSRRRINIESKDDMRKRGVLSPDRADAMAIAFAGRANAAPMNVESHAGESITGDLMTKAWLGQPSPKGGTAI